MWEDVAYETANERREKALRVASATDWDLGINEDKKYTGQCCVTECLYHEVRTGNITLRSVF